MQNLVEKVIPFIEKKEIPDTPFVLLYEENSVSGNMVQRKLIIVSEKKFVESHISIAKAYLETNKNIYKPAIERLINYAKNRAKNLRDRD